MIQEEKELLLKDLCARLPYGVIMNTPNGDGHLCSINQTIFGNEYGINISATRRDYFNDEKLNFKPYLRLMSSMTEEEEEEYRNIDNRSYSCPIDYAHIPASERIDWLNAHYFDYRGLIDKSLAIEVTEENNPYKE